jgi:hypothetical protein
MSTKLKPVVSQWYRHLHKGQQFYVTALDEDEGTVEIQHFDGDLEEMDIDEWNATAVEPIAPPEDWTGPVDDIERDDLGYSETDMEEQDWQEPMQEKAQQTDGEDDGDVE